MKKPMTFKNFIMILLAPIILVLIFTIVVDPFFHYHAPLKNMPYLLKDERYQNDGIVKHFEYEAIISGSSETENFKASEFEELFGVNTVKTCFAGGNFNEVNRLVETALAKNRELKVVFRSLDLNQINSDKDKMEYDEYPTYLYDSNPLNDYKYIFNKYVFLQCMNTIAGKFTGKKMTDFDEYAFFADKHAFGKEAVLSTFARMEETGEKDEHLTDEEKEQIRANLEQNVINAAVNNPDVRFIFFFPPYSAYYWDAVIRTGQFEKTLETEKYAYELLTNVPNIELYSFNGESDITCNPDNYMDTLHYSAQINSLILSRISEGDNRIEAEDVAAQIEKERVLYGGFDYDTLFDGLK
ncbi:MAG: hypothetical protein K6D96_10285 [Acetatifactor sp.]|nr:hypothetical protein [Acetatifactor sp.]